MSTRKKRTLSGVVASTSNENIKEVKVLLPAAVRSSSGNQNQPEVVRGTEFLVEPTDFRPWRFHNRDSVWMTIDKCQDLISSIRKNGQKVPIFARKLESNSSDGKRWEIIAGRRRWFACNYLGIKVRVKAVDASDRECAILMNLENKDRNDISEFEDAISYKQQLDAKLFDSQDEMASALELKKSKLSKMLTAAKLINYPEVMDLFSDITLLKINPIYSFVLLLERESVGTKKVLQKAVELKRVIDKNPAIKVNVIINELMKAAGDEISGHQNVQKMYKLEDKVIVKASTPSANRLVLEINKSNIAGKSLESVKAILFNALAEYI